MKKFLKLLVLPALVALTISCGQNASKQNAAAVSGETAEITSATDSTKADDRGYIVKVGDMVPEFDLHLLDGTKLPISSLKGKVVMLQFTASWCGVCRKEMPFIEKDIWLKHKDNPDFALYGIDLKEDAETTKKFSELIPVTYPLTLDLEGKTFELFCQKGAGVTRNIILDRTGKIIMLTRLFDEAEFNSMVDLINKELEK